MAEAPGGATLTLIFDGDDTLWKTMPLYSNAKRRFFALLKSRGLDEFAVASEFETRDVDNVARLGFTLRRFELSMVQTYRKFNTSASPRIRAADLDRIRKIVQSIAASDARPRRDAATVLRSLRQKHRLILATKGAGQVQRRRIEASGLSQFFERIFIVRQKDADTFLSMTKRLRVLPSHAVSIGNSARSDVLPAIAAGMQAIWIPNTTWAYEDVELPKLEELVVITSLKALPRVVDTIAKRLR